MESTGHDPFRICYGTHELVRCGGEPVSHASEKRKDRFCRGITECPPPIGYRQCDHSGEYLRPAVVPSAKRHQFAHLSPRWRKHEIAYKQATRIARPTDKPLPHVPVGKQCRIDHPCRREPEIFENPHGLLFPYADALESGQLLPEQRKPFFVNRIRSETCGIRYGGNLVLEIQ